VKSGDSLSKICEQFYGSSGMWQHILKYQVPTIAATPNLIFPGQLIALPRGLKPTSTSAVSSTPTTKPAPASNASPTTAGKYTVAPAGDESWQESFQKDYLVSDRALTDSKSMTVAQIQKFLESKNSVLAKPYNGSTPAKMIYDACQKYGISPKVMLTRLQCEQGLISKQTATQKQLDWAVGVGCYDSGNWNQNFKGFDKQIEYCAHTYRRHYDDARARLERGEKITMNIDGQQISVKNAATYSFYKYCPHIQGNKLFFDVWRGYRSKF
ncbi:MAG: LysM peptidoglycan-binding domain-containing protein, partial [Candidatus Riflebacteria bacterium]|nr:LysM peptidoglycan-binding domain-containing protein [Candidatus Riflebacteria bacterium]